MPPKKRAKVTTQREFRDEDEAWEQLGISDSQDDQDTVHNALVDAHDSAEPGSGSFLKLQSPAQREKLKHEIRARIGQMPDSVQNMYNDDNGATIGILYHVVKLLRRTTWKNQLNRPAKRAPAVLPHPGGVPSVVVPPPSSPSLNAHAKATATAAAKAAKEAEAAAAAAAAAKAKANYVVKTGRSRPPPPAPLTPPSLTAPLGSSSPASRHPPSFSFTTPTRPPPARPPLPLSRELGGAPAFRGFPNAKRGEKDAGGARITTSATPKSRADPSASLPTPPSLPRRSPPVTRSAPVAPTAAASQAVQGAQGRQQQPELMEWEPTQPQQIQPWQTRPPLGQLRLGSQPERPQPLEMQPKQPQPEQIQLGQLQLGQSQPVPQSQEPQPEQLSLGQLALQQQSTRESTVQRQPPQPQPAQSLFNLSGLSVISDADLNIIRADYPWQPLSMRLVGLLPDPSNERDRSPDGFWINGACLQIDRLRNNLQQVKLFDPDKERLWFSPRSLTMLDRINIAVPTSEETMIMQINLTSAIERAIVDYHPHLRNPAAIRDPQLPSFTIIIRSNDAAMRPPRPLCGQSIQQPTQESNQEPIQTGAQAPAQETPAQNTSMQQILALLNTEQSLVPFATQPAVPRALQEPVRFIRPPDTGLQNVSEMNDEEREYMAQWRRILDANHRFGEVLTPELNALRHRIAETEFDSKQPAYRQPDTNVSSGPSPSRSIKPAPLGNRPPPTQPPQQTQPIAGATPQALAPSIFGDIGREWMGHIMQPDPSLENLAQHARNITNVADHTERTHLTGRIENPNLPEDPEQWTRRYVAGRRQAIVTRREDAEKERQDATKFLNFATYRDLPPDRESPEEKQNEEAGQSPPIETGSQNPPETARQIPPATTGRRGSSITSGRARQNTPAVAGPSGNKTTAGRARQNTPAAAGPSGSSRPAVKQTGTEQTATEQITSVITQKRSSSGSDGPTAALTQQFEELETDLESPGAKRKRKDKGKGKEQKRRKSWGSLLLDRALGRKDEDDAKRYFS